jgi:hypothetical protein
VRGLSLRFSSRHQTIRTPKAVTKVSSLGRSTYPAAAAVPLGRKERGEGNDLELQVPLPSKQQQAAPSQRKVLQVKWPRPRAAGASKR